MRTGDAAWSVLVPLAKHPGGQDKRERTDEPGDHALRNRPDVADRPTAAVVGVLRVLEVARDRVDLVLRECLLAERRHQVRADAHRFGNVDRCRVAYPRHARAREDPALAGDLMTARAVFRERLAPAREVAALRVDGRNGRST